MAQLHLLTREWVQRHGVSGAGLRLAAVIVLAWTAVGLSLILLGHALGVLVPSDTSEGVGPIVAAVGGLITAGSVVALATVPLIGWRLGRWAADARTTGGPAIGLALATVVITDLAVSAALALIAIVSAGLGAILLALVYFLYGFVIFGLPGFAMALPSAYLWARLMRAAWADEWQPPVASQVRRPVGSGGSSA
jgi:hypothetical protein